MLEQNEKDLGDCTRKLLVTTEDVEFESNRQQKEKEVQEAKVLQVLGYLESAPSKGPLNYSVPAGIILVSSTL